MQDLYEVLGVSRTASAEHITLTFKRLVKIYHPDTNPDPTAHKRTANIIAAYNVLNNSVTRQRYDSELKQYEDFAVRDPAENESDSSPAADPYEPAYPEPPSEYQDQPFRHRAGGANYNDPFTDAMKYRGGTGWRYTKVALRTVWRAFVCADYSVLVLSLA